MRGAMRVSPPVTGEILGSRLGCASWVRRCAATGARPGRGLNDQTPNQEGTAAVLQIEMLPVDRLVPYIRNARTHDADQIAQIAASIAEFGFTNPILIGEDEVIIAGHGRLIAAKALGLTEVPVIVPDHLTEPRCAAPRSCRAARQGVWHQRQGSERSRPTCGRAGHRPPSCSRRRSAHPGREGEYDVEILYSSKSRARAAIQSRAAGPDIWRNAGSCRIIGEC